MSVRHQGTARGKAPAAQHLAQMAGDSLARTFVENLRYAPHVAPICKVWSR